MRALSPQDPAELVVLKFSTQSAKTETLLNFVGFIIEHDPGPVLVIQPTQKPMAEDWSKDRLAPMLRDTPSLAGTVRETNRRNSDNTILHKKFTGGHITVGGANSPSGLASRPIRYLLLDEIDRYKPTKEGDSKDLAIQRTTTFWNRKVAQTSSPTFAGVGIDHEYSRCDQQYEWQLKCLHCDSFQRPVIGSFVYDAGVIEDSAKFSASIRYVCRHCGAEHTQDDECRLKQSGQYVCKKNTGDRSKGFWFNRFCSQFSQWADILREWESAKGDPTKEQVVVNTAFAETYEETAEQEIDANSIQARAEPPWGGVPSEVIALTAGVDVQHDRLELEVVGWGAGEESWSIYYGALAGDPTQREVWEELTEKLRSPYDGHYLSGVCIDSGYLASVVYSYVRGFKWRYIWAARGQTDAAAPLVESRTKRALRLRARDPRKFRPELIGVSEGKVLVYRRLAIDVPGPGYCHFPDDELHDDEFFKQLTAERLVSRLYRGQRVKRWITTRLRNEALDIRVLATAALRLRLDHGKTTLEALAAMRPGAPVKQPASGAGARKSGGGRRRISGGIR